MKQSEASNLELRAKSPFIVCENFVVHKAVDLTHFAPFFNQGYLLIPMLMTRVNACEQLVIIRILLIQHLLFILPHLLSRDHMAPPCYDTYAGYAVPVVPMHAPDLGCVPAPSSFVPVQRLHNELYNMHAANFLVSSFLKSSPSMRTLNRDLET